jgi:tartrate-resistant acid phosphatase type 5
MKNLLLFVLVFALNRDLQAQVLVRDNPDAAKKDSVLQSKTAALQFIAMGDWGRNGADHQKQVAVQLGKAATKLNANFIISTGDNFYPSGVISVNDPLFKYSFEDVYTDFSLQWDWYVVLGNHDYKSNPDAQVAYSKVSRRWKMPARYFSKKFAINGDTTQQVLIAFIDTNPLIAEFYKNAEYGPNVRTQDSTVQKKWLEKVLSDPSKNIKWKIVVGHHPMYSGGGRVNGYDTKAINASLKNILDKYAVDVYLSGHEHNLQHIAPLGKTQHFISGAASESTPVTLLPISKMAAATYGFMTFSVTKNEMLVQTVDDSGKVIYKTSIVK